MACSLGQAGLAQRAGRWEALSASALSQVSRTERGLRLVFHAGPGVAAELAELAALERECCAFATWSVHPDGRDRGRLILEISGDGEEAAAAARSLFPSLR